MNKKNLILSIIVLVVILIGGLFVYQRSRESKEEAAEKEESVSEDKTADWQTYKSEKYGYQIKFPSDWTMDDSQEYYPVDAITNPTEEAMVYISVFQDPRLLEPGGVETVIQEVSNLFSQDLNHQIEIFEKGLLGDADSYVAAGSYFDQYQGEWRFKEIGIYLKDGVVINVRANIKKQVSGLYGEIIDTIIDSFQSFEK